jgi:porphobilinogen synthase
VTASFPARRLRRLRGTAGLRRLTAETQLDPADLVAPLFVREGIAEPAPVASLPGVVQHTLESARKEAASLFGLGVKAFLLFGVPERKDEVGSGAWDPAGIVQVAVRELKAELGDDAVVMTDLCLDEYTDHGHCGVLRDDGSVDNDRTLELYDRVAVAQAEAGADVVAPSGMMDGQVASIRSSLDRAGHPDTPILAYSAKYASALYGPFRDAAGVRINSGATDRAAYQQTPANVREALDEIRLDLVEGADMVMVKPAGGYLDVVAAVRGLTDVPLGAYQVSGEYAMVHAAAERGWIDGPAVARELLLGIRRAGADFVVTYFARSVAERLADERGAR